MAEKLALRVRGREKNPSHIGSEKKFSFSLFRTSRWRHCLPKNRSRRKTDVSNTRANIRVHRAEHKCARHRSRASVYSGDQMSLQRIVPGTVPRDMNFLATLWLRLPFSPRYPLATVLLSVVLSSDLSFAVITPGEKYCWLYIQGGSTHKVGGHDSNGNVDVRWREFKIEFFLTRISRVIYPGKNCETIFVGTEIIFYILAIFSSIRLQRLRFFTT